MREARSQDKVLIKAQSLIINFGHIEEKNHKTHPFLQMEYVVASRSVEAAKTAKFPWEPATAAKTDVSVQVDKTCHGKCSRYA